MGMNKDCPEDHPSTSLGGTATDKANGNNTDSPSVKPVEIKRSVWEHVINFCLRRTAIERVLLVLLLLAVFALLVGLVVFIAKRRSIEQVDEMTATTIIANMDLSADPCQDFYQYSCGGWTQRNPIPDNRLKWTIHDSISDEVLDVCNELLNATPSASESEAVLKTKKIYATCMDEERIISDGDQPLLDFLSETCQWFPYGAFSGDTGDFTIFYSEIMLAMDCKGPLFTILNMASEIKIMPPMPTTWTSMNFPKDLERDLINETISAMYTDISPDRVDRLSGNIANFMEKINSLRCTSREWNSTSISEMQVLMPQIDWTILIERVFPDGSGDLPISILCKSQFEGLQQLLSNTSAGIFEDALVWFFIRSMLPIMRGHSQLGDLEGIIQTESESAYPRDVYCTHQMMNYMQDSVAAMFIDQYFDRNLLEEASRLFAEIRVTIKHLIELSEWLDGTSKDYLLNKIDETILDLAPPQYMFDPVALDKEFDSLQVSDKFISNLLSAKRLFSLKTLAGKLIVNLGIIRMFFSAGYIAGSSTVIIPLGTLLRPGLTTSMIRPILYSGIGDTIAHEFTHTLDLPDSFDVNQLLQNRSEKVLTEFKETFEADGVTWSPKTQQENRADISAIQISYLAYRNYSKGDYMLPNLNVTSNQLFFINFAQMMCGHRRNGSSRRSAKHRVNIPLRNMEGFARAYSCPPNSSMNPPEKLLFWGDSPGEE